VLIDYELSKPRRGMSQGGLDVPAIDSCLAAIDRSGAKILYTGRDGEHAEALLPAGESGAFIPATKCYMDLDRHDLSLKTALLPSALASLVVVRVNAYISPAGEGANLHFDSHDVVIVQLIGVKQWEFTHFRAVHRPLHNCVAPASGRAVPYGDQSLPVPTEFTRCKLRPGSWLLLPAGTWHRTDAVEYSISATLAVTGPAHQ
jgi:JmjC domain